MPPRLPALAATEHGNIFFLDSVILPSVRAAKPCESRPEDPWKLPALASPRRSPAVKQLGLEDELLKLPPIGAAPPLSHRTRPTPRTPPQHVQRYGGHEGEEDAANWPSLRPWELAPLLFRQKPTPSCSSEATPAQPPLSSRKHGAAGPAAAKCEVSDKSLFEWRYMLSPGTSVCRESLDDELQRVLAKEAAFATQRREAAKQVMQLDRVRARRSSSRLRRAAGASPGGSKDGSGSADVHLMLRRASVRAIGQFNFRRSSVMGPTRSHTELQKQGCRLLEAVKPPSSKRVRLRKLAKGCREYRLMAVRQGEFDLLPKEEQELLSRAWASYTRPLPPQLQSLSRLTLWTAMDELGLMGATEAEQLAVQSICREASSAGPVKFFTFCFELVPRIRARLADIQREECLQQFLRHDIEGRGALALDQCLEVLEKLSSTAMDAEGRKEVHKRFLEVFNQLKHRSTGKIGLEGFQQLVLRSREIFRQVRAEREHAILEAEGLTHEDVEDHLDELLRLHDFYTRHDHDQSGDLDHQETLVVLMEAGVIPSRGEAKRKVDALVHREVSSKPACRVKFLPFLQLVGMVRLECRNADRQHMRERFARYDKDQSGELSLAEASALFADLGLVPRCQQERDDLQKLLHEADVDCSGSLDFDEFEDLAQQATEMLRAAMRHREGQAARELGYSPKELAELRESFFTLDRSGRGELSMEECRETVTLMRVEMTGSQLADLFGVLDRDGNGSLNFTEFLYFMKRLQDPWFSIPSVLK